VSIDANVVGIARLPGGDVRLTLEQPDPTRTAGREAIVVEKPPANVDVLLDRAVWGGADALMCGEIRIGHRLGYGACVLHREALSQVERTGAGLPREKRS
jgi:hypothetical protein